MIDFETAKKYGKFLKINFNIVCPKAWHYGLNVELEHGKKLGLTNVTNDDILLTAKIALAHLLEFPDYYERLYKMEKEARAYWIGRKPHILK